MEVVFTDQIKHQRDISGTIGRARRKWKRLYTWFPKEQRRLYNEVDRIYEETMDKNEDEIFLEYSQERRLNKRILKRKPNIIRTKEGYNHFPSLKPIFDKFGRLPLLYYNKDCAGFCQQEKDAAM